jgi:hypothetical protein
MLILWLPPDTTMNPTAAEPNPTTADFKPTAVDMGINAGIGISICT